MTILASLGTICLLAAGVAAAEDLGSPPVQVASAPWARLDLALGLAPGPSGGVGPRLLLLPFRHVGVRASVTSWTPDTDVTRLEPPQTLVGEGETQVQAYQLELVAIAPLERVELYATVGAGTVEARSSVEIAQGGLVVLPWPSVVEQTARRRTLSFGLGARRDVKRGPSAVLSLGLEAQVFVSDEIRFDALGGFAPPTSGLLLAMTGSIGLVPGLDGDPGAPGKARRPAYPRWGRAGLLTGVAPGPTFAKGARVVVQPLPWLGVRGTAFTWSPPVEVSIPGTTQVVVGNEEADCTGLLVDLVGALHRGPLELYGAAGAGSIHSEVHADVMVPPSPAVFRDNAAQDDRAFDAAVGVQYHARPTRLGVVSLGVEAQWIFVDRPRFDELGGLRPQNGGAALWAGASLGF